MKNGREGLPGKRIAISTQFGAATLAVLLGSAALAPAVPPPTGVAPVLAPAGGFGIDGDLFSDTPSSGVGDWLASSNNIGGAVLDPTGAPLNPATTFHFIDLYNSTADNSFVGGLKWTDDPNTWQWTTGKPSGKTDINNVLLHFATDANGHSWVIIAADRLSTSGDSYIDFEFLQNTLTANADGTFTSGGPNGGRTANDLLLSLAFTSGGSVADFFAWRWQTNAATGGFGYNDATASLPAGKVFVAANTNTVSVPFGAFGQNTYSVNAFAEAALDLTALLGNFDPCLSIGVNTVMVKTKTSQSSTATISDFINPIQYTLRLGPSANAGPDQTQCALSAVTDFVLHGQATQGLLPIASTTWSVVNGSAVIDSPTSLVTTAHVASASATLRLTVVQANGCTETDDVVLSTAPVPSGSLTGPNQVCPGSTFQFAGPAGMAGYAWSITGNGAISGPTNGQNVTVNAGSACGQPFTLVLNFSNSLCSSACTTNVLVNDTTPPVITAPPNLVLECPADTSTNSTGVAMAQDGCSAVTLTYADSVTNTCGGTKVIARTWTATDACGNSASAVQSITVRDTTPPTITAPPAVTLECPADTSPNNTGLATAKDGCSSVVVTFSDVVSNSCGGTKLITRTWLATDACGNAASAVQLITVHDTTPPTITAPPNLVLECPADTTTNNTGVAIAQDGCSAVMVNYSDSVSNTCGNSSVITRTWMATDACGNSARAVQTITVQDTTPPTLTINSNIIVSAGQVWNFDQPVATDNCGSVTVSIVNTVTNVTGTNAIVATRTWSGTDACGNTSMCQQTVTVVGAVAYYQLVITQQPQSQTAPVGSDVSMNVVASGFGPSSYQWHFDGNNIDGATGSALKLGNVQFTNAGQYSVTVSNAAGILTSAPASLNVVPVLTMQPGTNGIILTWTGPFTLQSATDPAGPYTDVPGATSPYFQSTLGQPEMFFRLRSSDFDLVIERSGGNQTSLIVTGPPGVNFIIEASDDLLNWSDVLTNTAPCTWSDPAAPQHPWRMYRLRLMPISPNLTPLSSTPLLQIQASIGATPRLSNEVFDRPDENAFGLLVNGPGISGNAVQTELRWENGRVGRGLAS